MSNDSEAPFEERGGVLAHLFGVWYPKHHVVGIIEDRSSADRAADALRTAWRDAGAPEDTVRLFTPRMPARRYGEPKDPMGQPNERWQPSVAV